MKTEKIVIEVLAELERAETIHPNYPTNTFKALAIWQEEIGEVTKALLDFEDKGASPEDIKTEAIQPSQWGLDSLKIFVKLNLRQISRCYRKWKRISLTL